MKTQKPNIYSIIVALIIAVSIIISSYFIALGTRYEIIGKGVIFDKWTKQLYNVTTGEKFHKLED